MDLPAVRARIWLWAADMAGDERAALMRRPLVSSLEQAPLSTEAGAADLAAWQNFTKNAGLFALNKNGRIMAFR